MTIYKIPFSFKTIHRREETVTFMVEGLSMVVSIMIIPNSKDVLVSIFENGEPILINHLACAYEPIIHYNTSESGLNGDFFIGYSVESSLDEPIDSSRLGYDLFFYYMTEMPEGYL